MQSRSRPVKPVGHVSYHTKSTFSSPMRATPAADPMTRREPPVPAQKAISCHSGESIGSVDTGYIPVNFIHTMLLYMLCYVTLCYNILCYVILCNCTYCALLWYVMLYYNITSLLYVIFDFRGGVTKRIIATHSIYERWNLQDQEYERFLHY